DRAHAAAPLRFAPARAVVDDPGVRYGAASAGPLRPAAAYRLLDARDSHPALDDAALRRSRRRLGAPHRHAGEVDRAGTGGSCGIDPGAQVRPRLSAEVTAPRGTSPAAQLSTAASARAAPARGCDRDGSPRRTAAPRAPRSNATCARCAAGTPRRWPAPAAARAARPAPRPRPAAARGSAAARLRGTAPP